MRIYVASSWKNTYQPDVVAELRRYGHDVYDFKNPGNDAGAFSWDKMSDDWQSWTPEAFRNAVQNSPIAAGGWTSDYRAMRWADVGLLVMPAGNSAHVEIGQMMEMNKRTIILLAKERFTPDLMYLGADHLCVSLDEVLDILAVRD
jgi:hypothetical protein